MKDKIDIKELIDKFEDMKEKRNFTCRTICNTRRRIHSDCWNNC